MYHSSRSATECYFDCPKRRYLRYHYSGYGIDPILRNVPLTTGICVHVGSTTILKAIQKNVFTSTSNNERVIDFAVIKSLQAYDEIVKEAGFKLNENWDDNGYLYNEQRALTEALVRAYAIIEAPFILKTYQVIAVEKDLPLSLLSPFDHLDYPAKADAILLSKVDGLLYVYSLKTTKQWTDRIQASYREDLQGVTELAAVRQALKGTKYESQLGGVAYCFLVKGLFSKKEYGGFETDSPLIRGWKFQGPNYPEYAHSFWFPNPHNPSGKGRLSNQWQPFKVWESFPGGIKNWVNCLASGEIQRECPNPLNECVRSPMPSSRDDFDLDKTLLEVAGIERRVIVGLEQLAKRNQYSNTVELMSKYFPRNRRSCRWPTDCDFIPICHQGIKKPLESGYRLRIPHHEKEREEFYKIQEAKK
jgi:hypothetical protein